MPDPDDPKPTLPETIARLRELHENATLGPWKLLANQGIVGADGDPVATAPGHPAAGFRRLADERIANACLMTETRNALPALLDAAEECERLREELEYHCSCKFTEDDEPGVVCGYHLERNERTARYEAALRARVEAMDSDDGMYGSSEYFAARDAAINQAREALGEKP